MTNPDNNFKNKLYDFETPLGSNVSFDKVMAARSKKPGMLWWKPAFLVVATLSVVSLAAFFMGNTAGNVHASENASANTDNNSGIVGAGKQNAQSEIKQPQSGDNEITQKSGSNDKQSENGSTVAASNATSTGNTNSANRASQPQSTKQEKTATDRVEINHQNKEVDNSRELDGANYRGLFAGLKRRNIKSEKFYFDNAISKAVSVEDRELLKHSTTAWSFEALVGTGEKSYNNFDSKKDFSISGNTRFAQYSLSGLYDLGNGFALSAGFNYAVNIGNGKWQATEQRNMINVSSHVITIVQPGLPDVVKTVYDTVHYTKGVQNTGNIEYQMTKMSIPIGFRYHFGSGRIIWRASGTVAPGLLTGSKGNLFNNSNFTQMDGSVKNKATLDARIALGIFVPMSTHLNFVAEPTLQYQSIVGKKWAGYNTFMTGFSVGLVFKP